jgi:hypothetical protein
MMEGKIKMSNTADSALAGDACLAEVGLADVASVPYRRGGPTDASTGRTAARMAGAVGQAAGARSGWSGLDSRLPSLSPTRALVLGGLEGPLCVVAPFGSQRLARVVADENRRTWPVGWVLPFYVPDLTIVRDDRAATGAVAGQVARPEGLARCPRPS